MSSADSHTKSGTFEDSTPLPKNGTSSAANDTLKEEKGPPFSDDCNAEPINPFIPSAGDDEFPILAV